MAADSFEWVRVFWVSCLWRLSLTGIQFDPCMPDIHQWPYFHILLLISLLIFVTLTASLKSIRAAHITAHSKVSFSADTGIFTARTKPQGCNLLTNLRYLSQFILFIYTTEEIYFWVSSGSVRPERWIEFPLQSVRFTRFLDLFCHRYFPVSASKSCVVLRIRQMCFVWRDRFFSFVTAAYQICLASRATVGILTTFRSSSVKVILQL